MTRSSTDEDKLEELDYGSALSCLKSSPWIWSL
jgi:hypothetical protein